MKVKKIKSFSFCLLFSYQILAAKALADDFETVIVDKRFNSSSSVVITQKEIQKSHASNLTSLLATQANISIAQSGFQPNSIFLRGGDSSHVLILVDGIPYYDAASVQRTINLNSIDLKSIRKIEVIKGSQSVVFGGQALSGVIKIDTIPQDLASQGQVGAQFGSNNYKQGHADAVLQLTDHQALVLRASNMGKDARSPVLGSSKTYSSGLGTAEADYVYRDSDIDAIIKAQTSFDKTFISATAYPSYLPTDTDDFATSTYQVGLQAVIKLKNNSYKPILNIGSQKTARNYEQLAENAIDGKYAKQDYTGELLTARFEITAYEDQLFRVITGLSSAQEKMIYKDLDVLKSDVTSSFEGAFVKGDIYFDKNYVLEAGVRADYIKLVTPSFTQQIGLTLFKDYKIEYSSGIKQPSLFQLYSAYGNSNLQAEKSNTVSLSAQHNLTENLFSSVTLFGTEFSNLIISSGNPQKYYNVSKSRTVGLEFTTGFRIPEQGVTLQLNLGYQEPRDIDKADWLVKRPLRTASLKANQQFEKLSVGAEIVHNGERRDRSSSYGMLPAYTYLNLTSDYKVYENTQVFVRAQNISDQRFQSSYGYYDEGLNIVSGFELSF